MWSNPGVSVVWILVSQLLLYSLTNWTVSLLSTLSYLLLAAYIYTTWVYSVWPAVKVPSPPGQEDQETWTPVHPDVMSAPELQTFINNAAAKVKEVDCNHEADRRLHCNSF